MASSIVPQASQTLSCPLLNLPAELRVLIYGYTHMLSLDIELNSYTYDSGYLSKVWESTPLVNLAATCRLIAGEARHYVRSQPKSRRRAAVELSRSGGPNSYVIIRLLYLTCPTVDLKQFFARYNFAEQRYTSAEATSSMGFHVSNALRRLMTDVSLGNATDLKYFVLRVDGLQPRGDKESREEAMQRIFDKSKAGPASAESLIQSIFTSTCWIADSRKSLCNVQLPVFAGRPLILWV